MSQALSWSDTRKGLSNSITLRKTFWDASSASGTFFNSTRSLDSPWPRVSGRGWPLPPAARWVHPQLPPFLSFCLLYNRGRRNVEAEPKKIKKDGACRPFMHYSAGTRLSSGKACPRMVTLQALELGRVENRRIRTRHRHTGRCRCPRQSPGERQCRLRPEG